MHDGAYESDSLKSNANDQPRQGDGDPVYCARAIWVGPIHYRAVSLCLSNQANPGAATRVTRTPKPTVRGDCLTVCHPRDHNGRAEAQLCASSGVSPANTKQGAM